MPRIRSRSGERPDRPSPGRPDGLVCVGMISGPFGTAGDAKISSYCERPEAITEYSPLRTEDGLRSFSPEILRRSGKTLIVRLPGADTREQVAALKGTRLYACRTSFPEPGEDEFYHADLIGTEVRDLEGNVLGRVRNVLNHGAGDLLEVSGSARQTLLIPFRRETAPEVRLEEGLIIVDRSRF